MLCVSVARASHIYGADFLYEALDSTRYRISLIVYGDCSGRPSFDYLPNAVPQVQVYESGTLKGSFTLATNGVGVEVTPVCASEVNNTTCTNVNYALPGVKRYIYTAEYNVSYTSANWVFRFTGAMGNSQAGRTNSITNISIPTSGPGGGGGGSVIVLEAFLNNTKGPNSSPKFTTIPTPFYCVNIAQQYNQGAVDSNKDSLVYILAPGLETVGTVTYNSGYSATAPLSTTAGTFSFSSVTGQMIFTPNMVQQSLVVNQVSEYRNGVLVGTASREMTFIVLNNCNNTPPTSKLDTTVGTKTGGVPANNTTFNVCQGTDSVRLIILPDNTGGDTVTATVNGLPAGAYATITGNTTKSPVITIDMKTLALVPGIYNFFVTYKDNGCPLSAQQTQAYSILVIRPNEVSTSIISPTQCIHQAYLQYSFAGGLLPRSVIVAQGGNVIRTFTDHSGSVQDSLGVGTYSVTISSPKLTCPSVHTINVVDSGLYPFTPKVTPVFYCKDDMATQLTAIPDSGAVLKWYNAQGTLLPVSPTPRTDSTGIFTWYTNQRFKVCESNRDSVKVYVTKRPIASISGPSQLCLSDTVTYLFDGTIGEGPILDYIWKWDNAGYAVGSDGGPWRIHWYSAGTKTISLHVEENKCPSAEVFKEVVVKPVPFAGFNVDKTVCQYDTLQVTYNSKPFSDQKYAWDFDGADIAKASGPGPYTLRYGTPGTKHLTLTVDLDGCTDTRDTNVLVHPAPDASITNAPGPVCIGDKVYLEATGGVTYAWTPFDSLRYAPDGRMYAQILNPITYSVKVRSEFGCVDSALIAYSKVEPCCTFGYPNAFTPNGDGRNDRFRIVTYGNHMTYELSIYNRWGQRVYYGLDAKQGWDGNYSGKPCDAGSYFYYLNAQCFTGHQETYKGDVTLIR